MDLGARRQVVHRRSGDEDNPGTGISGRLSDRDTHAAGATRLRDEARATAERLGRLDVLTGGTGADGFYFDSPLDPVANVDRSLDFVAADDTIYLDRSIFTALASGGTLEADFNGDNAVNSGDISAFLTSWLASVQDGTLDADFNGDNIVPQGNVNISQLDVRAINERMLSVMGLRRRSTA